jgi:hypothetical protein
VAVQEDWKLPRRARECAISGQPFAPGDRVVSELFDRGDEFERRDRLESSTPNEEDRPYSRWTSNWPPEPERAPGVDLDLARRFLRDLLAEDEPDRQGLAYILALLLIRKKRLKMLDRGISRDGTALLRASLPEDPDGVLEVPVPPMTPDAVAAVSAQVAELFGFGPPPAEEVEEGESGGPAEPGEGDPPPPA